MSFYGDSVSDGVIIRVSFKLDRVVMAWRCTREKPMMQVGGVFFF